MCNLFSQLAADSMLILKELKLINDEIIKIIPYKEPDNDDFFASFYEAIKEKFETKELLPAKNEYVERENTYWAEDNPVLNLFSDEQLAFIIDEENAKWVFRSFVRNQTRKDEELRDYIENCTNNWYEMSDLLKSIDADFIENQSDEWLHKLYEYLSKNNSYWSDIKTKPIFLNQERQAAPAFEQKGKEFHEILFLPSENLNTTEKTINSELLKNEKTKEFIENFGIKQPSLKDEIYNNILPLYEKDGDIDTETHFKKFFNYWKKEGRPEEFISLIKDKEFVSYKTIIDETTYRGIANEIYFPTLELKKYFETKPTTKFVDLEDYYTFITDEKEQQILKEFLLKLGVKELPKLFVNHTKDTYYEKEKIYYFDGLQEFIKSIDDSIKSIIFGDILKKIQIDKLQYCEKLTRPDGRHNSRSEYFISPDLRKIRKLKWLLSNNGEFVAPHEITINELADEYEKESYQANQLIELLQFKPLVELTEAERKLQTLNEFENDGYDENRIRKLIEEDKAKQNATTANNGNNRNSNNTGSDLDDENSEQPKISKNEKTIKDNSFKLLRVSL